MMKNAYGTLKHYIDVVLPPDMSANSENVTVFMSALDLAALHPEWAMYLRQSVQEQLMGIQVIPETVREEIADFVQNHPVGEECQIPTEN